MPPNANRAPDDAHDVWSIPDARAFLRERCGLDRPRPGFVTENHSELFARWRDAIERGTLSAPFSVTHIDANADLGKGDAGYNYLMTSLLFEPVEKRTHFKGPRRTTTITDGNFLLYAIACRWINDLTYVWGDGGDDELRYAMEGFTLQADRIQLAAMEAGELAKLMNQQAPRPSHLEPPVPYRSTRWDCFTAEDRYDFVCLTRSPPYTPASADVLYDAIIEEFIEPSTLQVGA